MKFKFSYLMLVIALAVATCAGYFSVWGLSQLFAGASSAVIIMATVLEVGKVITTTALHKYWDRLAKSLRVYLTFSVIVLMVITSAGIYGFLSNAYQKTANKLEIHEGELSVLDSKKALFEKSIQDNEKIVTSKNKRIDQLTNLRNNQENRLDSAKTSKNKDKVRNDIALASVEIQKLTSEIDLVNSKNAVLSDSVGKYTGKALELKATSSIAGEVGPLKYIAELTGAPMGKVVNYLILLLICVFDPLAIALILITNKIFELDNEGVNEGVNEPLKEPLKESLNEPLFVDEQHDDSIDNIDVDEYLGTIEEPLIEPLITNSVDAVSDVVSDAVSDGVSELTPESIIEKTKLVSDAQIEVPVYKKEPVITTGKIEVENIKEIRENRGYSTPIPQQKGSNTIERIGANKVVKNGDNNKVFFKRK